MSINYSNDNSKSPHRYSADTVRLALANSGHAPRGISVVIVIVIVIDIIIIINNANNIVIIILIIITKIMAVPIPQATRWSPPTSTRASATRLGPNSHRISYNFIEFHSNL